LGFLDLRKLSIINYLYVDLGEVNITELSFIHAFRHMRLKSFHFFDGNLLVTDKSVIKKLKFGLRINDFLYTLVFFVVGDMRCFINFYLSIPQIPLTAIEALWNGVFGSTIEDFILQETDLENCDMILKQKKLGSTRKQINGNTVTIYYFDRQV